MTKPEKSFKTESDYPDIDYLIVGQGLAGSILAWQLAQTGCRIQLIDNDHHQSSSMVAAGLVNPVTGKRLVLSDDTPRHLDAALSTYQAIADEFQQRFFHPLKMLRLLKDENQKIDLNKRLKDIKYQRYIGKVYSANSQEPFSDEYGSFLQHQTGFLDIPGLLAALKKYFHEKGLYQAVKLSYPEIQFSKGLVNFQQIHARKIIFCEGHQGAKNPWFDCLPFQLAKGEILTLKSPRLKTDKIINRANWLIPTSDNTFRTGANNQWQFNDDMPTSSGRQTVENNFRNLFRQPVDYQITAHQAGIRPATRDKQPFIGSHPVENRVMIFNGFGARGSMTIPYYAKRMVEHLINQMPLPTEADINRYSDRYSDPMSK